MALQSNNGELRLVLRVTDEGSIVVQKFAENTDKSAKKSGKGFDDFASGAGINLKSVAFYAGLAAVAIVGISVAMVKSSIDSAAAAGKLAAQLGSTSEEVSKLTFAVKLLGDISQEEATTGLRVLNKNIGDAAQGAGDAKFAILDLGLNAQKLAHMLPQQQLEAIADAMARVPLQVDRVRIANDLFGRNSLEWVQVLQRGSGALREATAQAEKFGIAVSTTAAAAALQFNDNMKLLKANLEGMAAAIAGPLVRALANITSQMLDLDPTMGQLIQQRVRFETEIANLKKHMSEPGLFGFFKRDGEGVKNLLADLTTQLDEVNAKIKSTQDAAAAAAAKAAAGGSGGGPLPVNSRQAEEFRKFMIDLQKANTQAEADMTKDAFAAADLRLQATVNEWRARAATAQLTGKQMAQFEQELGRLRTNQMTAELQKIADDDKAKNEANAANFVALLGSLDERFAAEEAARVQVATLNLALDDRQIASDFDYWGFRGTIAAEFQDKLTEIEDAGLRKRYGINQVYHELNFKSAGFLFGQLALLMQTHHRSAFKIGQVAAIANTLINTRDAAVGAYKALASIPYIGPFLGAAAALAATAYGFAQVQSIRSQSFDGGGGAGAPAPVFNANPGTGLPVGSPGGGAGLGPPNNGQTIQIFINGFVGTEEFLNNVVLPAIANATNNGDFVLMTPRSRTAQDIIQAARAA